MQKEIFNAMKREFQHIGLLFLLSFIIFKAVFFKESLWGIFRVVLSIFWLFVLPGYFIMLYWKEKLEFIERIVIGIALAAGTIGILSYYLGLIGLNIKYHVPLLPLAIMGIGLIAALNKKQAIK
ncbi:hypothetical protein HYX07_02800 [Candidatus Woesearchaeota archaeon]|nr:hypothetical protein [Candidatus Woesearchaeota archaeon]